MCIFCFSPDTVLHQWPSVSNWFQGKQGQPASETPTGGVATLKLTDVHPSDTGTYLCQVNNPPDFYSNGLGLINLTVLGKAGWGATGYSHTLNDRTDPAKPTLHPHPDFQLKHTTALETLGKIFPSESRLI